ncbi:hypothetical protein LCGC14_1776800 [marine sediment metagenome]|uniref:Uncharacterized protein n=1 Tax=marine sediment metagenome TaxID=412755 RepID=A0A0F9GWQ0_9ZZZZ
MTDEKPTCPVCKLTTVRYRVRTNSYICIRCGHQWPKK